MNIENFEQYQAITKSRKWMNIFVLNGVAADTFGTKKELEALADHLEEDETVLALASGLMGQTDTSNFLDSGLNTWLAVLTDRRVLALDAAMLTRSIDTQTIRLDRIQSVSSSQGFLLGKIIIDLGARLLTIDNTDKQHARVFASMANKMIETRENVQAAPQQVVVQTPTPEDNPIEKLKELGALKEAGILTEEEFDTAKQAILTKMAA